MFVAFRRAEGTGVHIDRMSMTGRGARTHVVEQGLVGPTVRLVYDERLRRVFWCDSHTGNIESTSVDGDDRHAFRALMTDPISLAVLGNDMFWSNADSVGRPQIYWADKHNGAGASFNKKITLNVNMDQQTVQQEQQLVQLVAVTGRRTEHHPCLEANHGGCSHLCLQAHQRSDGAGGSYRCECPVGYQLQADNVTCHAVKHCTVDEYKCNTTDICIPRSLRCDGHRDCMLGDDEQGCHTGEHRRCAHGAFECSDGQCVPEVKVCDLHYDCADNSDEMNCNGFERLHEPVACRPGMYQCRSDGKCILDRLVCDGIQDCDDGTDEADCHSLTCTVQEYRCTSGACIPATWECDREPDCPDGSDEHSHCGMLYLCINPMCTYV